MTSECYEQITSPHRAARVMRPEHYKVQPV